MRVHVDAKVDVHVATVVDADGGAYVAFGLACVLVQADACACIFVFTCKPACVYHSSSAGFGRCAAAARGEANASRCGGARGRVSRPRRARRRRRGGAHAGIQARARASAAARRLVGDRPSAAIGVSLATF